MSPLASAPSPAASLVVVLVEPAGPRNVGSIARLCANFEVRELRLVAPRCDHRGEEARQMAVHGAAVLEQARLFPSLAAALADCRRVVASSGRRNGEPLPLHDPASALDWLIGATAPSPAPDQNPAPAPTSAPVALVFGREDRGLSNAELLQAGRLLCIDTGASYGSLNLAQAAAIVLHQWQQRRQAQPRHAAASSTEPGPEPSTRGPLEAMLSDAEALLLEVGFLYPHTAAARMAKLRALLQRAQAGSEEVALLRGMVRQLRWASRHQPSTEPRADPGQTP